MYASRQAVLRIGLLAVLAAAAFFLGRMSRQNDRFNPDLPAETPLRDTQIIVNLAASFVNGFEDDTLLVPEYRRVLSAYGHLDPMRDNLAALSPYDRHLLYDSLLIDAQFLARCNRLFVNRDVDQIADPVFDVIIRNPTPNRLLLTHIGLQIDDARQMLYTLGDTAGDTQPAIVPLHADYEILVPALFTPDAQGALTLVAGFPETLRIPLEAPWILPPDGIFRCSLRLRNYFNRMPNATLFQIVIDTDHTRHSSPLIYLQTH